MSKVWMVTGSSRGLGRAIVQDALGNGEQVIATARRPEQLEDLVARFGDRVLPVAVDVTNPVSVAGAVKAGRAAFERIDVVVNNAGYSDVTAAVRYAAAAKQAQVESDRAWHELSLSVSPMAA